MERPVEEWKRRLRGLDPDAIMRVWRRRAEEKVSWQVDLNFHVAAAERMKQLGNMAIDIDEKQRVSLCRQAASIYERVTSLLANDPERLAALEELRAMSDAYHEKVGTRTARHYMMEQGVIDDLGDRLVG